MSRRATLPSPSRIRSATLIGAALAALCLTFATSARADLSVADCAFQSIYQALRSGDDTTGLRREYKFVVKERTVSDFVAALEARFGKLEPRDRMREGQVNVTETDYAEVLRIVDSQGKPTGKAAKLRVRRYGERPVGTSDPRIIPPERVGSSKIEIKLDHENYEGVVYKPSVGMADADIQLLLGSRETFFANREQVLERTLARPENAKAQDEVRQVLDVLGRVYSGDPKLKSIGLVTTTEYQRTAYELRTSHPKTGAPVRVQFTIDAAIRLRKPGENQGGSPGPYTPELRVVEVKIPVEVAFGEDLTSGTDDLSFILKTVDQGLRKRLVPGFPEGRGKASTFKRHSR